MGMLTTQEVAALVGVSLAAFAFVRQILRDRRNRPKLTVVLDDEWSEVADTTDERAASVVVYNHGERDAVLMGAYLACIDDSLHQHVIGCTHTVVPDTGVSRRNEGEFLPQVGACPSVPAFALSTSRFAELRAYQAKVVPQEGSACLTEANVALFLKRIRMFMSCLFRGDVRPSMIGWRGALLAYPLRNADARFYRTAMCLAPVIAAMLIYLNEYSTTLLGVTVAAAPVMVWLFRKLALIQEMRGEQSF